MTDTTLAPRLEKIADASRRDDGTDIPLGQELREAAATITRLTADNKALTARAEIAEASLDLLHGPLSVAALTSRAVATEAKLAKVGAENERITFNRDMWASRAADYLADRDRISAELAEARKERDRYRAGLQTLATTFYKEDQHQDYAKHVLNAKEASQ